MDLIGISLEVIRGEHPQRHARNPHILRPREQLGDLVRPTLPAVLGCGAHGFRPAAVPIEHDGDVLGQLLGRQLAEKLTFVHPIEEMWSSHANKLTACHTSLDADHEVKIP